MAALILYLVLGAGSLLTVSWYWGHSHGYEKGYHAGWNHCILENEFVRSKNEPATVRGKIPA